MPALKRFGLIVKDSAWIDSVLYIKWTTMGKGTAVTGRERRDGHARLAKFRCAHVSSEMSVKVTVKLIFLLALDTSEWLARSGK